MIDDREPADGIDEPEKGFEDQSILCVDCGAEFAWTSGEQEFFRDKGLKHAPKRCRDCKKAKSERIDAESAKSRRIEVSVTCDSCSVVTTVPFYPSQGRPVLCRDCFLKNKK